ncbi:sodium:solute symporter family protein [Natrarchaeobius oligotrophus]|uniref:Sodium:solute symporter family protein n=1 Tax=Natrarchaeobius chitinivorans TaxID=1679083 RepID=A0A3N6NQY9_NATCH|nr:sodium:solute symporter family protein [Natrarchaeobius chitinivorans]RQH02323.1 sodium:solute symporter family protein [Natrarchaeobius chitinivorans]
MVSMQNIVILAITVAYLIVVLGVGMVAARATGTSREDFLMADRSFGTVVLLFALFATNMTAVVMIGAPGLAYQTGAGALGFFVALFAFLFPVLLMTFGYRIWLIGKRFGHITPGQIANHRWEADYLGVLFMVMFTIWTIPYILVGVQGGGIVFEALTEGLVPYWLGALIVIVVVGLYVYPGGMRGTGWTNTFQGMVFLVVLLGLFAYIALRLGGFGSATESVAQINDGVLLDRAGIPPYEPRMWFSQGIIVGLGGFMFPHLVIRYMTARSVTTLRQTSLLYPIAIVLAWVPAVMIGFWGIAAMPDIDNPDFILPTMVFEYLPWWVIGIALAGILAAMMSSIDGQVLTMSTFFTEDVVSEFFEGVTDKQAVWYARVFLVTIFGLAYVGALLTTDTIVDTATFAFAGYGMMFVPLAAAFYWRWSTKEAVYVGLLYGFIGLWLFEFGPIPASLTFGFHPFVPLLVTQFILMVIVSAVTQSPSEERINEYESALEDVW